MIHAIRHVSEIIFCLYLPIFFSTFSSTFSALIAGAFVTSAFDGFFFPSFITIPLYVIFTSRRQAPILSCNVEYTKIKILLLYQLSCAMVEIITACVTRHVVSSVTIQDPLFFSYKLSGNRTKD